ncbi:MAG: HD domain-containing protein [Pseudonocardiaceae bacterium]
MTSWAACQAKRPLSPPGDRWLHVRQVAEQARRVARIVPSNDREVLVTAAYLHDIGYAPVLVLTRFDTLDGARWVRDSGGRAALELFFFKVTFQS